MPPPLLVPSLPVLELWRSRDRRVDLRFRPGVLPAGVAAALRRVARDAVQAGVTPVLGAPAGMAPRRVRALLARSLDAYREERSRIWPLLEAHVRGHWLVLFPMLREAAGIVRRERLRVPIPDSGEGSPEERSVMALALALRTYELTVRMTLGSMGRFVGSLGAGRVPAELRDRRGARALLGRLDDATAALEFGTLLALRLLESPGSAASPAFEGAAAIALRGADEQHAILRGLLRAAEDGEPSRVAEQEEDPAGEIPPEVLLADWVRSVLAA